MIISCNRNNDEALFPREVHDEALKDLRTKLNYLGVASSPLDSCDLEKSEEERAALDFLYAYMITPDMYDYSVQYHLDNVRQSLRARREMTWGKEVPALLFRHFVLPVRVGNEAIDEARLKLYEILKPIVEGLTMRQAVLELNHWCHQHVTYAPSDGRTLSPLSTMNNALGRCGEESVFTVAVLRTMGIPARQVYTPRWAHTDDNHAWVEAWVDGKWHYLGACEPAPDLNRAWFDAPVKRAMLLHAKAFGRYNGSEETLSTHPSYTEINVTSGYVPTGEARVRVVNETGAPQANIPVTFRLYNYAELYPLVHRTTDAEGYASCQLGLGDVVVLAGDSPERIGYLHYSVRAEGEVGTVTLRPYESWPEEVEMRLVPPIEQALSSSPNDEAMLAACQLRMAANDSVRHAHEGTFATIAQADSISKVLGLGDLEEVYRKILPASRANRGTIEAFVATAAEQGKAKQALSLLTSLTPKDLCDIAIEPLMEFLELELSTAQIADPNIISLRVDREVLRPNIKALQTILKEIRSRAGYADIEEWHKLQSSIRANTIVRAVRALRRDDNYNPVGVPLDPVTAWRLGVGDERSLRVLLVRLLRLDGHSSYYNTVSGVAVYKNEEGKEVPLPLDPVSETTNNKEPMTQAGCVVELSYTPEGYLRTPLYETNFTIGYIDADGAMGTYGFDWQKPYDSFGRTPLVHTRNFLSSGTRLADGTVLYRMVRMSCDTVTPLKFAQDTTSISVIGSMNPEELYYDLQAATEKSILSTTGRGYFVVVIGQAHHEPTDHVLRDLQVLYNGEMKKMRPLLVLTRGATNPSTQLQALLPQAVWGRDTHDIASQLLKGCQIEGEANLPLIAICDTFGRIVSLTFGYSIGSGERVARLLTALHP